MISERTHYFAKPGLWREVLALRRRACAVRRDLGLPSGRIHVRSASGDAAAPDVVWECDFADEAAQQADLAARGESPAFEAVSAEMRTLPRALRAACLAPRRAGARQRHAADRPATIRRSCRGRSPSRAPAAISRATCTCRRETDPFPCMICNHGSGIDKDTFDVSRPGSAALLLSWGIASFLPHRRGYGNSPGPAWREEVTLRVRHARIRPAACRAASTRRATT